MGNKIVDHSDVVGASPVGAAPTTSSFSTEHLASLDWATVTARRDEKHLSLGICVSYIRDFAVGIYASCYWYGNKLIRIIECWVADWRPFHLKPVDVKRLII